MLQFIFQSVNTGLGRIILHFPAEHQPSTCSGMRSITITVGKHHVCTMNVKENKCMEMHHNQSTCQMSVAAVSHRLPSRHNICMRGWSCKTVDRCDGANVWKGVLTLGPLLFSPDGCEETPALGGHRLISFASYSHSLMGWLWAITVAVCGGAH